MELKTRSLRDHILKGRKLLKDKKEDTAALGLGKSFINESLCPEFRKMDFVCRKLKKNKLVEETWFFNGRLYIVDNEGSKLLISHMNDFDAVADESVVNAYFRK